MNATPAAAQNDEVPPGWHFTAELAAVLTGGNSASRTFGVGGTLRRIWEHSEWRLRGKATRTESTLITRTAVGTSQSDFTVEEERTTAKTAELFTLRTRYDYNVGPRFFAFGGADWLRNTFAGIDSRLLMAVGAGNTWAKTESVQFKTDYGLTYTFEQEVVDNPFLKSDFPGLRLGYELAWNVSASAEFESTLLADWNLNNTDDVRLDFSNELPISISDLFSLKPSVELLWRNAPALTEVPLFDSSGTATGETVVTPLQKLDTLFTLAVVFKI
jgi:putative salt-induced outer membrane protein YdiY